MITEESSPKAPIMVIAFAGWNDAGGASTWAIRSLLEKTIATEILTFDSEDYYDFSRERPTVHLDGESRYLSWPKNTISLSDDGSLLLMEGVEPQLNWKTFTQSILAEAQNLSNQLIGYFLKDKDLKKIHVIRNIKISVILWIIVIGIIIQIT